MKSCVEISRDEQGFFVIIGENTYKSTRTISRTGGNGVYQFTNGGMSVVELYFTGKDYGVIAFERNPETAGRSGAKAINCWGPNCIRAEDGLIKLMHDALSQQQS